MISILFALLLFCLLIWGARALMAAFGIGDPIATIVYVFLVFLFVAWAFQLLGGGDLFTLPGRSRVP